MLFDYYKFNQTIKIKNKIKKHIVLEKLGPKKNIFVRHLINCCKNVQVAWFHSDTFLFQGSRFDYSSQTKLYDE